MQFIIYSFYIYFKNPSFQRLIKKRKMSGRHATCKYHLFCQSVSYIYSLFSPVNNCNVYTGGGGGGKRGGRKGGTRVVERNQRARDWRTEEEIKKKGRELQSRIDRFHFVSSQQLELFLWWNIKYWLAELQAPELTPAAPLLQSPVRPLSEMARFLPHLTAEQLLKKHSHWPLTRIQFSLLNYLCFS